MISEREIYAGVLLKSATIEVTFAERLNITPKDQAGPPLSLYAYERGSFDMGWKFSHANVGEAFSAVARQIASVKGIRRVGIGSYGPLLSVALADRDADIRSGRHALYGTVNENSVHDALKSLPVFGTMREALRASGCTAEVVVNTDVMCGALAEAFDRRRQSATSPTYKTLHDRDVVVFFHIAEGVGGAFVTGTEPWTQNALHPEMGYIPAQLMVDDPIALRLRREEKKKHKRSDVPIFIQDVASLPGFLERAKNKPIRIEDVSVDDPAWEAEAFYVSQLCAAAAMMIAPHQLVLHGPIIDLAPKSINFLKMVRTKFQEWINLMPGPHLIYDEMKLLEQFIASPRTEKPMLRGAVLLAATAV